MKKEKEIAIKTVGGDCRKIQNVMENVKSLSELKPGEKISLGTGIHTYYESFEHMPTDVQEMYLKARVLTYTDLLNNPPTITPI